MLPVLWRISLYEFARHKTKPLSIAFSRDGTQFVCVAEDKHNYQWHANNERCMQRARGSLLHTF
eukprot:SAG11_NODE_29385_length_311_cov_0.976415_1_plen_63_part_10